MPEDKSITHRQHRHLGVYGICIIEERILLIRKARGPFTGLLDLPGGGIEFGEEPEAALRREFIEETGLTIQSSSLLRAASKLVRYRSDDGIEKELHHVGLLYTVVLSRDGRSSLPPCPKSNADGQGSDGAAWLRLDNLDVDTLTPFAQLSLDRR
jgi:8-oxo-dGTP pyrophosphatase MutT (NUDIX family)